VTRAARRASAGPDGTGGVTLWRRIADDLERDIAGGAHAAGERLPGEVAIAGRFGVNRHTVRRALAELAERGLVRAERGSGTYVEAARLAYPIGARTRFS
jgi:GntR family transcriptional regulator, phosphonate transport system regulatory protein